MANSTCAAWGARARSTTFARIAGGTTCTTSLRAAKVTHTAPTDGATTFDSPFSAVLLAVWEFGISLSPRFWSERGLFCMVSGLIAAYWRRSERRRRVPVPFCSRWRDATPFTAVACPPDDGGDARRRARTAHTARQAERARPKAGRQTAFSRWPRTQPRRGPRPQLSRPSLGGRGHSCFLPP